MFICEYILYTRMYLCMYVLIVNVLLTIMFKLHVISYYSAKQPAHVLQYVRAEIYNIYNIYIHTYIYTFIYINAVSGMFPKVF